MEYKLNNFLWIPKRKDILVTDYDKLFVAGFSSVILYSLPKTRKSNVPLRPILSAVSTPTDNFTKFLVLALDHLTVSIYSLQTFFNLIFLLSLCLLEIVSRQVLMCTVFLLTFLWERHVKFSLMVYSLMVILISWRCRSHTLKNFFNWLWVLFCLILMTNITDGMPMGSPLDHTFANAFVCANETKWSDFPFVSSTYFIAVMLIAVICCLIVKIMSIFS